MARRARAQLAVDAALGDAEAQLPVGPRRRDAALGPARRALDRPLESALRGAPAGGHSSNAMAMSEPSDACTAMASSGVKRATEPS